MCMTLVGKSGWIEKGLPSATGVEVAVAHWPSRGSYCGQDENLFSARRELLKRRLGSQGRGAETFREVLSCDGLRRLRSVLALLSKTGPGLGICGKARGLRRWSFLVMTSEGASQYNPFQMAG